jgi:hypothetical protein
LSYIEQEWKERLGLLVCSLPRAYARIRCPLAAGTADISSPPGSQPVDANSIQPSTNGQVTPYRLEQDTAELESQRLKDYTDANEQISVFGIDMRIETRMAEKEIRGLLAVDVARVTPRQVDWKTSASSISSSL